MAWLFLYGVLLLILGTAATWLEPAWLGNTLAALFLGTCMSFVFILTNVPRFLPFKVTRTAPATVYRWKTRQAPEWMYRACRRVGFFCLLYGDALIQECPEQKADL